MVRILELFYIHTLFPVALAAAVTTPDCPVLWVANNGDVVQDVAKALGIPGPGFFRDCNPGVNKDYDIVAGETYHVPSPTQLNGARLTTISGAAYLTSTTGSMDGAVVSATSSVFQSITQDGTAKTALGGTDSVGSTGTTPGQRGAATSIAGSSATSTASTTGSSLGGPGTNSGQGTASTTSGSGSSVGSTSTTSGQGTATTTAGSSGSSTGSTGTTSGATTTASTTGSSLGGTGTASGRGTATSTASGSDSSSTGSTSTTSEQPGTATTGGTATSTPYPCGVLKFNYEDKLDPHYGWVQSSCAPDGEQANYGLDLNHCFVNDNGQATAQPEGNFLKSCSILGVRNYGDRLGDVAAYMACSGQQPSWVSFSPPVEVKDGNIECFNQTASRI